MQLSFLRAVKAHTILLLSFVLLFTTGCEDDDHDNDDHGHTDADGFILESNGTEIYREFEGSVTGSVALNVGDTLVFTFNISGSHPFWIKTTQTTGTSNGVTTGTITNNGQQSSNLTWDTSGLPAGPTTYYYICQFHSSMSNVIVVF